MMIGHCGDPVGNDRLESCGCIVWRLHGELHGSLIVGVWLGACPGRVTRE